MDEAEYIFTYPIDRLLAKPSIFSYIEDKSGVPYEYLSDAFYTLFELVLEEIGGDIEDGGDGEEPEYIQFRVNDEGFELVLNTGQSLYMEKNQGGIFKSKEEIGASFEVNTLLMKLLREVVPEDWRDDFGLDKIPTPENNFLTDSNGDCFRGQIYRLSNPEEKMSFMMTYLGGDDFDVQIGQS